MIRLAIARQHVVGASCPRSFSARNRKDLREGGWLQGLTTRKMSAGGPPTS